jgi:predicted RNA-binding Zn-ribbon protein involved in translation (DUF1610 family)
VSAVALGRFLARRLAEAGRSAAEPVTVEELRLRLVPYRACRGELDLATKAEYDLSLLALLCEPELVELRDESLREAVGKELASPEPGLEVLDAFGSALVGLGPELGGEGGGRRAPRRTATASRKKRTPAPEAVRAEVGEPEVGEPEVSEPEAGEPEGSDVCRSCGEALPGERQIRFCPFCGADQQPPRCDGCGEELEPEWRYCPACGRAVEA